MIGWFNGQLSPISAITIDPTDRGFLLGDGVFETILVRDSCPIRIPYHLHRLGYGLSILDLSCPYSDAVLADALTAVAKHNRLTDGLLRLTLTRGPGERGITPPNRPSPTVMITPAVLPPNPTEIALIVSRITRRNEASPLSRIKSLNYLDSVLARMEAVRAGADDAVLLNSRGDVAETSVANLVALINDEWITPPIADGALPGIARQLLVESGLVQEGTITLPQLLAAETVVTCNTRGICRISTLDEVCLPCVQKQIQGLQSFLQHY